MADDKPVGAACLHELVYQKSFAFWMRGRTVMHLPAKQAARQRLAAQTAIRDPNPVASVVAVAWAASRCHTGKPPGVLTSDRVNDGEQILVISTKPSCQKSAPESRTLHSGVAQLVEQSILNRKCAGCYAIRAAHYKPCYRNCADGSSPSAKWECSSMDGASAYGAEGCRFESCHSHCCKSE